MNKRTSAAVDRGSVGEEMLLSRRSMLKALAAGAGAGLVAHRLPAMAQEPPLPGVPGVFQPLYRELDAKLTQIEEAVSTRYGEARGPVNFSPELITANSNRGEGLLLPGTVDACAQLMERLKEMGAVGVTLSVNFPLLTPSFPRYEEYLAFYRRIVEEARLRGLRVAIETTNIFPDPEFSSIGVNYSGLTLESYQRGKRMMAETILAELRPDFLTVESESTTVTRNTGLAFGPDEYLATVRSTIDGLTGGGTRIGAGSGTWDDVSLFERLARETAVDYIDLHIYPIRGDLLWPRAGQIAEVAQANGKFLTVGESWLYKAGSREGAGPEATAVNIFGRDVYSFWSPLDQRFLRVLTMLARGTEMGFVSVFWSQFLFAYIDFNEEVARMTYGQRARMVNERAAMNIVNGVLSPTGEALRQMLARTE